MRLASFPKTTPWFRRSLGVDGEAEIVEAKPSKAVVSGTVGPNRQGYTARIEVGAIVSYARGATAIDAFRAALAGLREDSAA